MTDFLEDTDFKEWVISPTPDSDVFWKDFVIQNPEKAEVIENARSIIEAISDDMDENMPDEIQVSAAVIVQMVGWFLKPAHKDLKMTYKMLPSASENIFVEKKKIHPKNRLL